MAKTTKKADTVAAKEVKETKPVETKAAVETKVEKAPAKAAAAKTEAKKPAAKKAAAPKKPAAKKAAAPKKPAAEKAPKAAKSSAVKTILEYKGVQVNVDDIVAAVKADWTGAAIKSLEIYVKPEDAAAYYVVNGGEGGKVTL